MSFVRHRLYPTCTAIVTISDNSSCPGPPEPRYLEGWSGPWGSAGRADRDSEAGSICGPVPSCAATCTTRLTSSLHRHSVIICTHTRGYLISARSYLWHSSFFSLSRSSLRGRLALCFFVASGSLFLSHELKKENYSMKWWVLVIHNFAALLPFSKFFNSS